MPIPTSITDLSTSDGTNSPQGGDPVAGNIDNYFRAHAGIIRRQFSAHTSSVASASTTTVPANAGYLRITKTAAAINGFSNTFDGHILAVKFAAAITLTHGSSFVLPYAQNIITQADEIGLFVNDGGTWRLLAYSNPDSTVAKPSFVNSWSGSMAGTKGVSRKAFAGAYLQFTASKPWADATAMVVHNVYSLTGDDMTNLGLALYDATGATQLAITGFTGQYAVAAAGVWWFNTPIQHIFTGLTPGTVYRIYLMVYQGGLINGWDLQSTTTLKVY